MTNRHPGVRCKIYILNKASTSYYCVHGLSNRCCHTSNPFSTLMGQLQHCSRCIRSATASSKRLQKEHRELMKVHSSSLFCVMGKQVLSVFSRSCQNLVFPCRLPQVVRLALMASLSSFRANRMSYSNRSAPTDALNCLSDSALRLMRCRLVHRWVTRC